MRFYNILCLDFNVDCDEDSFVYFSPTVIATTGDLPPSAPALEVATASYQSLKLRWGAAKNDHVGLTYTLQMIDKLGR